MLVRVVCRQLSWGNKQLCWCDNYSENQYFHQWSDSKKWKQWFIKTLQKVLEITVWWHYSDLQNVKVSVQLHAHSWCESHHSHHQSLVFPLQLYFLLYIYFFLIIYLQNGNCKETWHLLIILISDWWNSYNYFLFSKNTNRY